MQSFFKEKVMMNLFLKYYINNIDWWWWQAHARGYADGT